MTSRHLVGLSDLACDPLLMAVGEWVRNDIAMLVLKDGAFQNVAMGRVDGPSLAM